MMSTTCPSGATVAAAVAIGMSDVGSTDPFTVRGALGAKEDSAGAAAPNPAACGALYTVDRDKTTVSSGPSQLLLLILTWNSGNASFCRIHNAASRISAFEKVITSGSSSFHLTQVYLALFG